MLQIHNNRSSHQTFSSVPRKLKKTNVYLPNSNFETPEQERSIINKFDGPLKNELGLKIYRKSSTTKEVCKNKLNVILTGANRDITQPTIKSICSKKGKENCQTMNGRDYYQILSFPWSLKLIKDQQKDSFPIPNVTLK
ncbi:unnamed protein product [Lepeophtheirus salmonis]|uniref:(salmon louse) hypothetical protein n=1 Tax=Lepeophtheirus salmonis TaxID=72036 RepID=A0A7R8H7C9_LEPSM|nr:unnamed protein product [Lepeophtheirus salmonis]CAF2918389.1 unnamed protein product [Lepeophtheirus salmonis]